MKTTHRIIAPALLMVMGFIVPSFAFAQITFRNPLNTVLSPAYSAHFDNDGSSTNGAWRDYQCGSFSYDGHDGVDFRAVTGTPVYAAAPGRVYQTETQCPDIGDPMSTCGSGYGNHYRIDHDADTTDGRGLVSIYAHLTASSVTIPAGTPVSCGQQAGLSGASGRVTGPHLHFGLRTDGALVSTKTDAFNGACSHPIQYWSSVSSGVPTTQCYAIPLAPSNLYTSNPTASSLTINFRDNALNETSITIERKVGAGSWTYYGYFNALSGAGLWNWTNTGLSPSTTYCYRFKAANASGSSGYSNETCGTTQSGTVPPPAPSNVYINNATSNSLRVNFTDNATNETDIFIERKMGTGGFWISLGSFGVLPGAGSWYWDNTGLSFATTYCYRLNATNSAGSSAYSNEACGVTL